MPLPLLDLFKYLLIVIVWLFFIRVVRAIWVEVKTSESNKKTVRTTITGRQQGKVQAPVARQSAQSSIGERSNDPRPGLVKQVEFRLLALEGPYAGKELRVKPETIVGRSPDCTISLADDSFASSKHAKLLVKEESLWLEDLDSTNGTRVNESKILEPVELSNGDRFSIGKSVFEVIKV